jgi:hypothetical protein
LLLNPHKIALFFENEQNSAQLVKWAGEFEGSPEPIFCNPVHARVKDGIGIDYATALFYRPFPELIKYLESNGVKCYVYGADRIKQLFPPEALKVKKRAKSKSR